MLGGQLELSAAGAALPHAWLPADTFPWDKWLVDNQELSACWPVSKSNHFGAFPKHPRSHCCRWRMEGWVSWERCSGQLQPSCRVALIGVSMSITPRGWEGSGVQLLLPGAACAEPRCPPSPSGGKAPCCTCDYLFFTASGCAKHLEMQQKEVQGPCCGCSQGTKPVSPAPRCT